MAVELLDDYILQLLPAAAAAVAVSAVVECVVPRC